METKGRSLKAATPRASPSWGHRSNSVPDLKGQQVESHNGKTERNKTTRAPSEPRRLRQENYQFRLGNRCLKTLPQINERKEVQNERKIALESPRVLVIFLSFLPLLKMRESMK